MKTICTIVLTAILTFGLTYAVSVNADGACAGNTTIGEAAGNIADWTGDINTRLITIRDTALSPSQVVDLLNANIYDAGRVQTQVEIIQAEIALPPPHDGK